MASRHAKRLAGAGAVNSVGSVGDSHDNGLAESVNELYKAELMALGSCSRALKDCLDEGIQ